MSIPVENRKYKTLDVVDGIKIIEGDNSHAHNVYVDSKTGEIGRKTHSKKNRIELDQKEWNIVNKLSGWTKKKN